MEKVGDPLDSNFFNISNDFSSVDVFSYTPLPPCQNKNPDKCFMCKNVFGVFQKKITCSNCGMFFCEKCASMKNGKIPLCNVCCALSSENSRVLDFPGLAEWAKKHMKTDLKTTWSIQCAFNYLFRLLKLKDSSMHLYSSTLLHTFIDAFTYFKFDDNNVKLLTNHSLTCECGSAPLLLDVFVTLMKERTDFQNPFDDSKISSLLKEKDPNIVRAAARIALLRTERKDFNPDQKFVVDALKETKDKLTCAYLLSALAQYKHIPEHYEIFRPDQDATEIAYENYKDITEACFYVYEPDTPVASQASQYYASVILYQISAHSDGTREIMKHPIQYLIDCIRKHYPHASGVDKKDTIISVFIAQVIYDLWLFSMQAGEDSQTILNNLFSIILQPLTEVLLIYVPYDPTTSCACLQTIFMNLGFLVEQNEGLGGALANEQFQTALDRLRTERRKPLPRSLSNSSFNIKSIKSFNSMPSLLLPQDDENSAESIQQEMLKFKENELEAKKADADKLRHEIDSLRQQMKLYEDSTNEADNEEDAQRILEEAQNKVDKLEQEIDNLESQIENNDKNLEDEKDKLENIKEKAKSSRHNLIITTKKLEEKKAKLQEFVEEIQRLSNEIENKTKQITEADNSVKDQIDDAEEAATRIKEKTSELDKMKVDIEEAKKKQEESSNNLSSARQELAEQKKAAENAEEQLEKYREEIERQNVELKKVISRTEEKKNDNNSLKEKISNKKQELQQLEANLNEQQQKAKEFDNQLQDIEQNQSEEDKTHLSQIEELNNQIKEKNEEGNKLIAQHTKEFHSKLVKLLDSYIIAATPLTNPTQEQSIETLLV